MRSGFLLIAAGLLILGIGIGIGIERHWPDQSTDSETILPAGETALEHIYRHLDPEYVCPMHPDVVSKEPGNCPICGMVLVSREIGAEAAETGDTPPVVSVAPEFIHNFGVRTAAVERGPVARRIDALGRVARMPQPRIVDVTPGLAGELSSVTEKDLGDSVNKGELLYEVDAPEWRRLQQAYLAARKDGDGEQAIQLTQRLRGLGMDAGRLQQLEDTGEVEQILKVFAPRNGTIVEWQALPGDMLEAGTPVVTLGGVNRVPVVVSIFEGQGAWIRRGQRAIFRVPTLPGTEFTGQVDRTDREINFSTRTLPVYAGFSTADPRISYGMLVEVTIEAAARQNVLRIPREALIQTGSGSRVIVALGAGRFQPVEVVSGLESSEYVEILSGLEEGQEVVVSGQFLIDSESSLTAGFQRMERGVDAP